ncbi:MAG TPA: hypothetical protein VKZ66_09925 [Pusillimonas sp.]|nr:hypothetical protein [Pusillimonas sp.]
MDTTAVILTAFIAWLILRTHYQRSRIALLGRHLSTLQLERHMETLTQGYMRAIHEDTEARQLQVLETFAPTEQALAAQGRALADSMQKESAQATAMGRLPFTVPYIERLAPSMTRDFRKLLQIHAAGLRRVVDNEAGLDPKSRAYQLSAELYLLQHSCHWFCKSRGVADARLMLRHKVDYQKVLESVSDETRAAYQRWLQGEQAAGATG